MELGGCMYAYIAHMHIDKGNKEGQRTVTTVYQLDFLRPQQKRTTRERG